MGYPELDRDESIILETRNIKFKSISFDAILTNKRIILTDSKKNVIPSQNIALSTIRNVEAGENAIRDHFLILAIITDTGEKHQTVLTFVRQSGGERKRECSEWAKKLKNLIPSPIIETSPATIPVSSGEPVTKGEVQTPAQGEATTTRPAKKKIETALPLGKITEKTPVAPIPKETSSLPSGSFCSRCGNRVPFKSTFCNHCGTPIKHPSERTSVSKPVITSVPVPPSTPLSPVTKVPVPPPAAQPVITSVPVPPPTPLSPVTRVPVPPPAAQPVITSVPVPPLTPMPPVTRVTVPPPAPQPVIIETQVSVPPMAGSRGEHQSSQIDQIIHSIEPLIEDSIPRTQQSASLVQKHDYQQKTEPAAPEPQAASPSQVLWPVLPNAESPVASTQESTAGEPESPQPHTVPGPAGKKPNYLAIGILIIAILPILAGLVIVANIMSGPSGGLTTTIPVTTVVTTITVPPTQSTRTPVVTESTPPGPTQVMVPPNGVWVRASYPGSYIGLIGTPGNQLEVSGTGDKFYPISTSDGIVAAALQKKDGSGDKILLEVYRNGVMLKRESTVTPRGIVEVQLDLKLFPVP
jgi:hypothetical protein